MELAEVLAVAVPIGIVLAFVFGLVILFFREQFNKSENAAESARRDRIENDYWRRSQELGTLVTQNQQLGAAVNGENITGISTQADGSKKDE